MKIIERVIIEFMQSGRVFIIATRNKNNHALPGTRQQNAIGVFKINLPLFLSNTIPSVTHK